MGINVSEGHTASIFSSVINPKITVFPDEAVCGFSADITLRVVWEGPLQCPRNAELAFATIHVVMCQELSRGEVNIPFHAVWFCYRKLE